MGDSLVGYGWSAMLAPVARIAGPNLVSALPAIIIFNVVVLLPVAMLALYGIAARIGGRVFGYWAVVLWITLPFVGIAFTNLGYHQKYTELLLPQAFGLTGLADFPTMVAAVVSAYFCSRVLFDEKPQLVDALAAGARGRRRNRDQAVDEGSSCSGRRSPSCGAAVSRRCAVFAAGLAPALLALAVWKERGLGHIPAFGNAYARAPARRRPERRNPGGRHRLRSLPPPELVALREQHRPPAGAFLERTRPRMARRRRTRRSGARSPTAFFSSAAGSQRSRS